METVHTACASSPGVFCRFFWLLDITQSIGCPGAADSSKGKGEAGEKEGKRMKGVDGKGTASWTGFRRLARGVSGSLIKCHVVWLMKTGRGSLGSAAFSTSVHPSVRPRCPKRTSSHPGEAGREADLSGQQHAPLEAAPGGGGLCSGWRHYGMKWFLIVLLISPPP